MLGKLRTFFKAIIGGASYATDPVETGAIYLKDELKKSFIQKEYNRDILLELAKCAQEYSEQMYLMSQKEEKVTYFVNHLDYILILLQRIEAGEEVHASEPIKSVLIAHGVKVSEDC